jgi:hypothetical protein
MPGAVIVGADLFDPPLDDTYKQGLDHCLEVVVDRKLPSLPMLCWIACAALLIGTNGFSTPSSVSPDDCAVLLSAIGDGETPNVVISELKRVVIALLRDAPIAGNRAHLHLPIVRYIRMNGISLDPEGHTAFISFYAHYTERFFGKHDRHHILLVKLGLEKPLSLNHAENKVVDPDILKPESLMDSNGSISSAVLADFVPALTHLQAKALTLAQEQGVVLPGIRRMDLYKIDMEKQVGVLRIELGALAEPDRAPIAFLASVAMKSNTIGPLFPELTKGLPAQEAPLKPDHNTDQLVYDSSSDLQDNIVRAVQTKLGDDQTHMGDSPAPVEILGKFSAQQGERVYATRATVLLYNETTVSIDYLVLIHPDQKMSVIRSVHFDSEGDPKNYSLQYDEIAGQRKLSWGALSQLMAEKPSPLYGGWTRDYDVSTEGDPKLIASFRSRPTRIETPHEGEPYILDPNRYYHVYRIQLKLYDRRTRETSKTVVLGATEGCGDDVKEAFLLTPF